MTLSTTPVFAQTPKTAGITFGGSSQSTQMDPGTVAPTVIITAGTDGAIVTSMRYSREVTNTTEKVILWLQPLGTGNWYIVEEILMAAHTIAATTAQPKDLLVDPDVETSHIRLAGTDKLGVTHHVDQQAMVSAQYTDF